MMTMKDFYMMKISEGGELRKKVETEGKRITRIWNSETYRYNVIYNYNGDSYQIDSQLGIVDVNDTAKELQV